MKNVPIRIAIAGVGGRMGLQLIQSALKMNHIEISAALEYENSPFIGNDVGKIAGSDEIGINVQGSLSTVKDDFDVFIDFSCPKGTMNHLKFCKFHGKSVVIGTTGFNKFEKQKIQEFSKYIAIVFSANFSVGINVMISLLEKTAKVMGKYTDIEIIEAHHRKKLDIPSGTAIAMGEAISYSMNKDLKDCIAYENNSKSKERIPGMIGFSTIRAGDIVGEHTAMFIDSGERIEITHKVSNREVFAKGALRSAMWIYKKNKGLFDMKDVLGITKI